ncbi:MAG: endonuclease I, partial [Gammaproteobacteria bacterium]|nr:endonuclease I [Gammaproteobacteria bacterium]
MSPVQAQTVLSEVLYDASTTDNGNVFVELYGTPGSVLDGLLLEGVNGADGSVYRSVALAGT